MAYLYFVILISLTVYFKDCHAECTFPNNLSGNWISAEKGVLSFTNASIVNYPVGLSASVNSTTYTCEDTDGTRYLLKGTPFQFGSDTLRPHLCIELYTVSNDVMYYYLATSIEPTNNERVHVRKADVNVTINEACDRTKPFDVGTFVMLINEGANISSSSKTCPTMFLRTFENVSIIAHDNTSRCDGSRVDVCANISVVQYTYSSCPTSLTYSNNGTKHCLFDLTDGQTTYLAVWNDDPTVDNSNTYRLTCYAMQDTYPLYATEYPGSCQEGQTPTSVSANGVKLIYSIISENCAPGQNVFITTSFGATNSVSDGNQEEVMSAATISVIIIAVIILFFGCLLFACAIKRFKRKKKIKDESVNIINNGQTPQVNGRIWIEDLEDNGLDATDTTQTIILAQPPISTKQAINYSTKSVRDLTQSRNKRPSLDSGRHSMTMEVEESPQIIGTNATGVKLGGNKEDNSTQRIHFGLSNNESGRHSICMELEESPSVLGTIATGVISRENKQDKSKNKVHFGVPNKDQSGVIQTRNLPVDKNVRVRNKENERKLERKMSTPHGINRNNDTEWNNFKQFSGTSTQTEISMGDLQTDDWKASRIERGISTPYVSPTYKFTYPKYHNSTHTVPYWELIRNITQQRSSSDRNTRSLWDAVHAPTRINPMPWRYWK